MCTQLYILSHFCGGEGGKGRGASNQWLASGCQTPTGRPWHKAFIITINQTSKILGGLVDGNPGQDRTSSPSSAPSWRRPLSTLSGSTCSSVRNLALAIPYDISRGHGPEARSLVSQNIPTVVGFLYSQPIRDAVSPEKRPWRWIRRL